MPELLLTIAFRGLMVLRQQGTGPGSHFEVGIHSSPVDHFLRISTIKNGVLDSIKSFPKSTIELGPRNWRLEIDNPVGLGVRQFTDGTPFSRLVQDNDPEDFRWTINLEHPTEFFGTLGNKITTTTLRPVLNIPNGRFYTRLKSHPLQRQRGTGAFDPFGQIGAAVGCDIRLTGTRARLMAIRPMPDPPVLMFTFAADEPNTIYEVVNAPPDVPTVEQDHFGHYYHGVLDGSLDRFQFREGGGAPAPSPALCGEVFLGDRTDPL